VMLDRSPAVFTVALNALSTSFTGSPFHSTA